ncbi:cytochrome P450 [Nocardia suismassiliense]|uniref:Cytochrome P450 n=1 Tax=Nocardia suismassiliense TaxID=2077092 RepID=A0ABW6R1Z8_9NOCA
MKPGGGDTFALIPGPGGAGDGLADIVAAGGLHNYQLRLHAEYGPVVRFRLPGAETAVSIADPVLLEATAKVDKRPEKLFEFLAPLQESDNLQTLSAEEHTPWRRVLLSVLAGRRSHEAHFGQFVTLTCDMADRWAASDGPIALQQQLSELSLRMICDYALGAGADSPEQAGRIVSAFEDVLTDQLARLYQADLPGTEADRGDRAQRALTFLRATVDGVLTAHQDAADQDAAHQDAAHQDAAHQVAACQVAACQDAAHQVAACQVAACQVAACQDAACQVAACQVAAHQDAAVQDDGHQDGAHQDGAHQDGAHQDDAHQDDADQDGADQDGADQDGADQDDADQNDADQDDGCQDAGHQDDAHQYSVHQVSAHQVSARQTDGSDLIAALAAAGQPPARIRDTVLMTMLAAHHTTGVAISWTLYLLAQHPDVADRVADELARVLGDRPAPDYADLKRLTYLKMVLEESMRLYPPGPYGAREISEVLRVGDYSIPAGTTVFYPIWAVHLNPEYWPQPEVFRPERFSGAESAGRPRLAYIPFGLGPRSCEGSALAMVEAQLVLAVLLRRFRFELAPGHSVVPVERFVLWAADDIRMNLTPRVT